MIAARRKTVPMADMGPTARARRLTGRLRQLREQTGLSQERAAGLMHWHRLKLVRIEGAKVIPSEEETAALCDLYGAPDTALLTALARDAGKRGWWNDFADVFHGSYVADEDLASDISTWQAPLVPGLLQTEDYARAVIANANPTESSARIRRRVQARMARRVVLTRADPPAPRLRAVFDESVLYRPVGGPHVHAAQLGYLLRESQRPNVELRVVPFAAGATPGLEGRFTLLEFDPALDLPMVVFIESPAGDLYVEDAPSIRRVSIAYEQVLEAALTPEHTAALISDACDRYRKEGHA